MGNPTPGIIVQIQPVEINSSPTPSGMSSIEDSSLTFDEAQALTNVPYLDMVLVEKNYDDIYLNPDLEAMLNTRGFSTQRPEILGMFEFLPPLSAYGEGYDYQTTSYGELFDYQCQLKQLRYTDALGFFTKMLEFSYEDASAGKIFKNDSKSDEYLDVYEEDMDIAKSTIDYLESLYESISSFIDGQNIKAKSFNTIDVVTPGASTRTTTVGESIVASLADIIPMPAENAWNDANTNFTVEEFIEYKIGFTSDWVARSSNTTIVLQLLSYLGGMGAFANGIYGVMTPGTDSDYSQYPTNGIVGYSVGINSTITKLLDWNLLYPKLVTAGGELYLYSEQDNNMISLSDVLKYHDQDGDSWSDATVYGGEGSEAHSTLGALIHAFGMDAIQNATFQMDLHGTGEVRDIPTEIASILGIDTSQTVESILDGRESAKDTSAIAHLIPENEDASSQDQQYVESFTTSNFNLAEGIASSRSGRSYYVDEIPTREVTESQERLNKLISNLYSLGTNSVKNLLRLSGIKKLNENNNHFSYTPGYDSNYSLTPSLFIVKIFEALAKTLKPWANLGGSGSWLPGHIVPLAVCTTATGDINMGPYDGNITRSLLKYILARDEYKYKNWREASSEAEARDIYIQARDDLTEDIKDHMRDRITFAEFNGSNGKDETSAPVFGGGEKGTSWEQDWSYAYMCKEAYTSEESIFSNSSKIGDDYFTIMFGVGGFELDSDKGSVFDAPIEAVNEFLEILETGCQTMPGSRHEEILLENDYTGRGINRASMISAAYLLCLRVWKQFAGGAVIWTDSAERRSSGGGVSVGNKWGGSSGWFDKRVIHSYINAFEEWQHGGTPFLGEIGDILTETKYDNDVVPWSTGYGYYKDIQSALEMMDEIYNTAINIEKNAIQTSLYIGNILDSLKSAASGVISHIDEINLTSQTFENPLEEIMSDEDFGQATLFSTTRDQISLARALYDSFAVPNREYPYLPASKAIMTNQSKNLAGFCKTTELLDTGGTGRKFIMPVAITAGMMESLRNRAMDSTGDLSCRDSTLVSIKIWRRNLLKESELATPREFVFDTSRFVIMGRPEHTEKEGSGEIDGDVSSPDPQTADTVLSDTVVRHYGTEGNKGTYTGKAYKDSWDASDFGYNVTSQDVFNNHAIDNLLKTYLRLTTGFDVSEDVFPFLEGNVFFDGVDPGKEDLLESLSNDAAEMFADRDLEASLNYDRLVGELKRSIILSSQKYRNRIVYPKVFERVFCMLVDQEWSDSANTEGGTYAQFYATVSILPPATTFSFEGDDTITAPEFTAAVFTGTDSNVPSALLPWES